MNNKGKIITFAIIVLISIGGLLCKGYLSDEVYVLNEEENTSKNTEDTINKNDGAENSSSSNSNEANKSQKDVGVKEITVYISGQVAKEGVVTLSSDKRLADAVEKLGGLTKNADTNNINLAMKLEDEKHYIIPKEGEVIQNNSDSTQVTSNKDNNSSNNATQSDSQGSKININTADLKQLDNIPGVGEATANKILSYRDENGEFKSIEEIKNVNGIGDKKFENMKDLICVK
nr:helix-hairpin-helix domain-containing protein [uncultured Intestinibacter sp.]